MRKIDIIFSFWTNKYCLFLQESKISNNVLIFLKYLLKYDENILVSNKWFLGINKFQNYEDKSCLYYKIYEYKEK